jgi:hypothetical protein
MECRPTPSFGVIFDEGFGQDAGNVILFRQEMCVLLNVKCGIGWTVVNWMERICTRRVASTTSEVSSRVRERNAD